MDESSAGKITGIRFLAEQDGPPERKLKEPLVALLFEDSAVESAYLVQAELSRGTTKEGSVVLGIRRPRSDSPELRKRIGSVFAAIFAKTCFMDVAFLTPENECDVAAVAEPFYRRSR